VRRLVEAGVLPPESALEPEPVVVEPEPVEPEPQGLFAPIIEAGPTGLHLVAESSVDLTDLPVDDTVSPCPNCNGPSHLDLVDLVGHTMHLTCENCGTMWQVRHAVTQPASS
jgi:hypothetical protein